MDFELIIVGAGPVGASLALAARDMRVALIARDRPPALLLDPAVYDSRVYALSPGNAAFLRELGVWQQLPAQRLAPVHAMRIFGDDGTSEIQFDAYRAGLPELAWTVEDGVLQEALWRTLDEKGGVRVFAPAECARVEVQPERVALHLAGGAELAGRLLVGADGARSFVREHSGIAVVEKDYGQHAVVANLACEKSHGNVAWQWFQRGPVLALLPLPGERVSMIWSLATADAERLTRLDEGALCREVEAATKGVLGRLSVVTPARAYSLRRVTAQRLVAARTALLGDAAHVIHPLAGQGLNLGLQDARVLAELLHAREPMRDAGDARVLRRYERSRAEPILAMDSVVDGLFRLFGTGGQAAARMRNAGLNLTDRLPVLKNILIRRAAG